MGAERAFKLSREAWAFRVWTVPSTALSTTTARITPALSPSPITADTPAANSRMPTRTSANCPRKIPRGPARLPAWSWLGP